LPIQIKLADFVARLAFQYGTPETQIDLRALWPDQLKIQFPRTSSQLIVRDQSSTTLHLGDVGERTCGSDPGQFPSCGSESAS